MTSRLILMALALALLPACTNKAVDLKSPCAGTDDSPCVRRAPVNQG